MPCMTLSPISILVRERNWIEINPERFLQDCFTVSKAMIRSLRHDPSIPREDDGEVRFNDIEEKFKAKFDGTSQWPINDWITCMAKGGGPKKRFQYCSTPNSSKHISCISEQFKDVQEVISLILHCKTMYCYHTEYIYHDGNVSEIHSINRCGLTPGGKSQKRQAIRVFHCSEPDGR